MPRDPNQPIPLTRWINGRMRVHFRSGHIADLSMTLHTAHSLRKQIEDKQGADSIGGLHAHSGWLWARHDEVVLTEWEPAIDYGWPDIEDADRPRLEALGMPHGILPALAEICRSKRRHSAAYSINAIAALQTVATGEPDATREIWDRMAVMLEGERGAQLAKPEVFERTRPMARPQAPREDPREPRIVPSDETEAPEADSAPEPSGRSNPHADAVPAHDLSPDPDEEDYDAGPPQNDR